MNPLLRNLLILDIETVSAYPNHGELSESLQAHWNRKASFLRNLEEKSNDELYFDRSAIYAEFGKIITIGMGLFTEEKSGMKLRVKSIAGDDEKKILEEFITIINKFDQDNLKLCGHNAKEFDFPYLCRRMVVNRIPIPWSMDLSGKKPWEVHHIDTMELWKFGDRKNFTSLKLLSDLLEIPSSKDDLDGSKVNTTYYNEKEGLKKIETYCQGDVIATAQLFLRLNDLPLLSPDNITNTNE